MVHNSFLVLGQYLGNYEAEIYGRSLVGKIPLSQKAIALTLASLETQGILKSRKVGNIKFFRLNILHSELKDIILSAEITRKIQFLKKHRKLANIFKSDSRVVGFFGSYASGTQRAGSDVDIFVVGKKTKDDYEEKGEKLDLNISAKYFSEREFIHLLKTKNNLLKEVVRNHAIIFGFERFVNLVWGNYYGFG